MYSGLHFMRGSRKGSDNSRKIEKGLWPPLPLPLPPPQTIYPPHPPPHEIISWIRACIYLSTINKHHSKINKNNTRIKKSMNIKYIFWYMFIFFSSVGLHQHHGRWCDDEGPFRFVYGMVGRRGAR